MLTSCKPRLLCQSNEIRYWNTIIVDPLDNVIICRGFYDQFCLILFETDKDDFLPAKGERDIPSWKENGVVLKPSVGARQISI